MTTSIIQFQAGKTYYTRSVCDRNCIYSIRVIKRTAKTITVKQALHPEKKLLRPYIYNGVEQVKPHGSYSLCAVIGADSDKELLPAWAA